MRGIGASWLAVALLLLGAVWAHADEQSDALAIIDKAIKAAGGDAKAGKLQSVQIKLKGRIKENDAEKGAVTADMTLHGFDKFRMDLQLDEQGRQQSVTLVFDGKMGWAKHDNRTEDAPADIVPILQQVCYAARMPHMLAALKDKAFALSPVGEMKIGDRMAVGVRAWHKDHRDVNLYFDKTTNLLIKCETRFPDQGGQEKDLAFHYDDYKDFDGVKHCQKFSGKGDGGKFQFETEVSEVKPQEKLGDDTFVKP
jgi:hypothetical protein